jgi:guanine nucleotide-binding protein subunit alpha
MFRIRNDLERRLGSASLEEFDSPLQSVSAPLFNQHANLEPTPRRPTEFYITSQKGWKSALDRALPFMSGTKKNAPDDTMEIIAGIGSDIKELWADNVVQAVLKKHKLRLEHASGLYVHSVLSTFVVAADHGSFLDDVDRLTSRDYEPTDDDIVRARLRTMGVQEYHFNLNNSELSMKPLIDRYLQHVSAGLGQEWILYDVGGARSSISIPRH